MRLAALAGPGRDAPTRDRPGPAGPSVPLHRMADHRGGRPPGPRCDGRPERAGGDRAPSTWTRRRRRATSKGASPSGSGPRWCWVGPGSPTTPSRPAPWWPCPTVRAGTWWPSRWPRPGPRPARSQGRSTSLALDHPLDAARRAVGRSPCGPPGSSPAISSPTPRGASPEASRRRPLANGGAFGGKLHSPVADGGPAAGRPARRPVRVAVVPGGRGAPRPQAAPGGRRHRRRRVRRPPGGGPRRRVPADRWACGPGRGRRRWPPAWSSSRCPWPGPPISFDLRAAVWAEAAVLAAAAAAVGSGARPGPDHPVEVVAPGGRSGHGAAAGPTGRSR